MHAGCARTRTLVIDCRRLVSASGSVRGLGLAAAGVTSMMSGPSGIFEGSGSPLVVLSINISISAAGTLMSIGLASRLIVSTG
jgi:hypothetical protein